MNGPLRAAPNAQASRDDARPPTPMHTLAPLLEPASIALIGVKGGPFDPAARDNMARRFLENLRLHGYHGKIYPVNPRHDDIGGLPCYPEVGAIPGPVDTALLIVPRTRVAAALAECGAKDIKTATIISSGFGETGPAGQVEERALVALAATHGMRLLGPNCFGYYNSHKDINLFGSASLLSRPVLKGGIGLVTQSGALAAAMVDRAQERGIGFSHVVTTGNQCDIDSVEVLQYLIEDPHARVLALFIEGINDGPRFRAALRRAAELGKPCLVLKTGSSEIGRAAALAHTGSLVGDDAVFNAVFRADGVIRCDDIDELFMSASLLAQHADQAQDGAGARLAVVSMSGAMGGLLADGAAHHGIAMATLAPATRQALAAVPGVSGSLNPLDAAMATWAGDFGAVGQIAGLLARDPGVDVVMLAISGLTYAERLVDDCAAAVQAVGKVFVPMWAADWQDMARAVPRLQQQGVTAFEDSGSALRALRALAQYRHHQQSLRSAPAPAAVVVNAARKAQATALLAAGTVLSEYHSKQLLALYGVVIAREEIATTAQNAVAAADRIGYPVVLKIHSADIAHKTEAGALRLGLRDAAQVAEAFAAVMAGAAAYRPDARLDGVLVAPMAPPGIELVVGATRDPVFGPVLLVGFGGILVEVLRDTALRIAPVDQPQALAMLDELRGRALLGGVRGQAAADRAAVAQVIVALSDLMLELDERVSAIDINPLIVHATGNGATVADALVVPTPPAPLPAPSSPHS